MGIMSKLFGGGKQSAGSTRVVRQGKKYALVEAVIRNDKIGCPYCFASAHVQYGLRGKRASCNQCSAEMQVTEVLPKKLSRELMWGIQDAKQLSQWLYLAWVSPILNIPDTEYVDQFSVYCKGCSRPVTAKGTGHIIQDEIQKAPLIYCRSCIDNTFENFNPKNPWDGTKLYTDSLMGDANSDGNSAARRFRKQIRYAPFGGRYAAFDICCGHCRKPQPNTEQVSYSKQEFPNGKLLQCQSCQKDFSFMPQ